MPQTDLRAQFANRGPWVTKFVIQGQDYGGEFDAMNDGRIAQFWEAFPDARTILELGSLEGGHTFGLAARSKVEYIVGIEGRQANVAKAKWVQTLLGVTKVQLVVANLESPPLSPFGHFDAVFCCGLLYHLPRPWELIEQITPVSSGLFLSTHYAPEERAVTIRNGIRGLVYQEFGVADPLSGLSDHSFWPTLDGLFGILHDNGFVGTKIVHHNEEHPHGPIITVAAYKRRVVIRRPSTERLKRILRSMRGFWKSLMRLPLGDGNMTWTWPSVHKRRTQHVPRCTGGRCSAAARVSGPFPLDNNRVCSYPTN